VDTAPEQVALDACVVDAEVSEVEGDEPSPSSQPHRLVGLRLCRLPLPMALLERDRQPEKLATRYKWKSGSDRDLIVTRPLG
jgi:hypothetical protein